MTTVYLPFRIWFRDKLFLPDRLCQYVPTAGLQNKMNDSFQNDPVIRIGEISRCQRSISGNDQLAGEVAARQWPAIAPHYAKGFPFTHCLGDFGIDEGRVKICRQGDKAIAPVPSRSSLIWTGSSLSIQRHRLSSPKCPCGRHRHNQSQSCESWTA